MSLIDTLFPWGTLERERQNSSSLLREAVSQRREIDTLNAEARIMKTRIELQKFEIIRLQGIVERLPTRDKLGRFASKKPA